MRFGQWGLVMRAFAYSDLSGRSLSADRTSLDRSSTAQLSSGGLRKALIGALMLTAATSAYAQDAQPTQTVPDVPTSAVAPPPSELSPELEDSATAGEVTVTGSRIARNGYDQPTPVTVIGLQEIQASAPANIADFVNQIPSVSGSVAPSNTQRNLSGGAGGINTINLRNLGSNRTLVLLDGHRSVASLANGTVDVNTIPQGLVKSVEVVTGGASSVYGSDAVAGVVNFILDRTYTGLKGEVSYGETTYGDDKTWRATLTGGMKFADGRGQALLSGNIVRRGGVYGAGSRGWTNRAMHLIINPAYQPGNGQPEYMPSYHSGLNTTTGGGIITSAGALRGTYFGQGGTVNHYDYGDNRSRADSVSANNSAWTQGGDYQISQQYYGTSLQPEENLSTIFGRVSYDLFEDLQVYSEISYSRSEQRSWGGYHTDKANVTIYRDNAFLPESVRSLIPLPTAANPRPSITLGTWNQDIPTRESRYDRDVQRYLLGFEGSFNLLNTDWKWDGYYQRGVMNAKEGLVSASRTKLGFAQDAILSNGVITCRALVPGSATYNPAAAAGCVPFNRMGIGVNSQAAVDYIMGTPYGDRSIQQDVAAINFNTNINNPWLQPIGLAFGVESRREKISGYVPPEYAAGWYSGNFVATNGQYTVTEGYAETLVPLPFKVEFNGAARLTHYSESGNVVTWKAGLTWQPISDIRSASPARAIFARPTSPICSRAAAATRIRSAIRGRTMRRFATPRRSPATSR
jgi:outer membrane receptor protein involved in Fe transport